MNQEAVDNFLSSMDKELRLADQIRNALLDYKMYQWDIPTIKAILEGIEEEYKKKDSQ